MAGKLPVDFDAAAYLRLNPDVAAAGIDAAKHYLKHGMAEGRPYVMEPAAEFRQYLSQFSKNVPSAQAAIDIFEGMWSTKLLGVETGGGFDATIDARITWLLEQMGSLEGLKILELGPLEAGHTIALEGAGAEVEAIEANLGAFLRCLVVKNQFDLKARFQFGDFTQLDLTERHFDLVFASGVLYHMRQPAMMLEQFARCSDRIFLWTHYFEPDLSLWNPLLRRELERGKWQADRVEQIVVNGIEVSMVRQAYLESLGWEGFCGGTEDYSYWIYKEDLLLLLQSLGFQSIEIAFDNVHHQNGPSFALLAQR